MKKTFLKCIAILSLAFITTAAFAETTIIPVETALQAQKEKMAITDTNIVVINYTNDSIQVLGPDGKVTLTKTTAARIFIPNYIGQTKVQIESNGKVIFPYQPLQPRDLVSVYATAIYVTH